MITRDELYSFQPVFRNIKANGQYTLFENRFYQFTIMFEHNWMINWCKFYTFKPVTYISSNITLNGKYPTIAISME